MAGISRRAGSATDSEPRRAPEPAVDAAGVGAGAVGADVGDASGAADAEVGPADGAAEEVADCGAAQPAARTTTAARAGRNLNSVPSRTSSRAALFAARLLR